MRSFGWKETSHGAYTVRRFFPVNLLFAFAYRVDENESEAIFS
jgi:hypothetical protein